MSDPNQKSTEINLLSIFERVVKLEGSQSALHGRLDTNEARTTSALANIVQQQGEILKDLKEVIGWMNRGKGWAAAAMLLSGMFGAGIVTIVKAVFFTHKA